MAVYKVPQDVEADDKLLGPFTFRQFIYLIIVAISMGLAWLLAQIFIGLIIIPAPIIIFFGALALPIKKDQPMEAYLGAMVSFYFLKPRKRLWTPDGLNSLVEITAPKEVEQDRTKDISETEARERLGYLTDIVESRGWAVRGVGVANQGIATAQPAADMFDETTNAAQRFDTLLESRKQQSRQALTSSMQQSVTTTPKPAASEPPRPSLPSPQDDKPPLPASTDQPHLTYNPYPDSMRQTIIQPHTSPTPPPKPDENTSVMDPSPAIIELANNSDDLSIATIAEQAHRIEKKEHGLPEGEVEISLH